MWLVAGGRNRSKKFGACIISSIQTAAVFTSHFDDRSEE